MFHINLKNKNTDEVFRALSLTPLMSGKMSCKDIFNNRSKNSLTSIGTPLKNCFFILYTVSQS